MMNRHMGRTLFRGHVNYRVLLLLIFAVVQLSSCGGGGGDENPPADDVPPDVPPTAVIEVTDGAGVPLVNGRIGYGEDFILSAKRSSADGEVGLLSYRWMALTSSGGGMNQGKEVETTNATLRISASHSAVPLGVQRYQLIVVDNLEYVSKPVSLQVEVIDKVSPVAVLDVVDGSGKPLVNGSVQYGQDFVLSGKGSSDTGGGSIVKYHWTAVTAPVGLFAGSGTVITGDSRLTVNASSTGVPAGTQTYRLIVEDDSGNLSAPVEVSVAVVVLNQPPTANIGLSHLSGFAPLTVDFDGSGSTDNDGTIASYAWSFGDGSGGSGVNVTHVYPNPGTYSIALTVTDDDGDTGVVDPKPQIQVLPAPVVVITPASVALEPGGTQQFNASVTGASNTSVVWSLSDSGCGSINSSGLFSAGNPAGSCINTVQAASVAYSSAVATATVSVMTCSNASFDVNTTADVHDANPGDKVCDDGSGKCTLRAAIEEANICLGANTVNVPAGTYMLSLGQLSITDELSVNGAGAVTTIIDGNSSSRIFSVASNLAAVSLSDLTLANGIVNSRGPALNLGGNTPMLIQRVIIRDNVADYWGCAMNLNQNAELVLIDSSIIRNRCEGTSPGGSAIMMDAGVNLLIRSSTIANNGPAGGGNGVIMEWSHGENPISVSIENSTIAGNQGTAIKATSWVTVDIKNSTITNNDEGVRVEAVHGASEINVSNSIFYGNRQNCAINGGTIVSGGHNIDSRDTCGLAATGDMINTDPLLGALADNGGLTQTRGLLDGSPAVDAGDNSACMGSDQRGWLRDDGSCDIGAYEGEGAQVNCIVSSLLVTSTLDAVDAVIGDGICDDGNGNCTLRAAVQEANACVGSDIINLPAGIYTLSIPRNPSGDTVDAVNGDLDITDDLKIMGVGAATTIIDGSDAALDDRLFQIVRNVPVMISDLTLQGVNTAWNAAGAAIASNGDLKVSGTVIADNTGGDGAGIYASDALTTTVIAGSTLSGNSGRYGGAVYAAGTLHVIGSTISDNFAENYGGAIYGAAGSTIGIMNNSQLDNNTGHWGAVVGMENSSIRLSDSVVSNTQLNPFAKGRGVRGNTGSTVTITRSTLSGNLGGGVDAGTGSVLTIVDSTIDGNSTPYWGGTSGYGGAGIVAAGELIITGSTISNNRVLGYASGAGLYLYDTGIGTITNSTITGNVNASPVGGAGGGVAGSGTLTVLNSTISGNTASYGGNINWQSGSLTVANSILANGTCDLAANVTVTSNGHNIDSGSTCDLTDLTDKVNTSPLLDPLADNGGSTLTHALQIGSPAIDAGDDTLCPATDQRGIARPQDGDGNGVAVCDVGAYEVQ